MPLKDVSMMTPRQCRAGRAYLGWSQERLAEQAGVMWRTVQEFEASSRVPRKATVRSLALALQEGGVMLLESEGLAPCPRTPAEPAAAVVA